MEAQDPAAGSPCTPCRGVNVLERFAEFAEEKWPSAEYSAILFFALQVRDHLLCSTDGIDVRLCFFSQFVDNL
jgi:hypothetical protein